MNQTPQELVTLVAFLGGHQICSPTSMFSLIFFAEQKSKVVKQHTIGTHPKL